MTLISFSKAMAPKTQACSILFTLLICLGARAQQFAPAYIIKNGQKTEGLVRIKAYNDISFKPTASSSAAERLDPAQIDGFGFTGYQESFKSINDSTGHKNFARILVQGSVALYAIDDYYLLQKESDKGIFVSTKLSGSTITARNLELAKTVGRIKVYLNDCPTLIMKKLSRDDLVKLANDYNTCKNKSQAKSEHRTRLGVGIVAGINIAKTSFTGTEIFANKAFKDGSFNTPVSPLLGLTVTFKPGKYLTRTNGGLEILYSQNSFTGHAEVTTTAGKQISDMKWSYKMVRLPFFLTYHFSHGHEGLYISPAATVYKFFSLNSHVESRETIGSSGVEINQYASDDLFKAYPTRSIGYAVSLGVGWSKYISENSKLNILVKGELDGGLLRQSGSDLQQKIRNYSLTAGYIF